jgi:hypothetical protein
MKTLHVLSRELLDKDISSLLINQVKEKSEEKIDFNFYQLPEMGAYDKEDLVQLAEMIRDIPIKVGHIVYLLIGDGMELEEHLVVEVLHKRFEDSIKLYIQRETVGIIGIRFSPVWLGDLINKKPPVSTHLYNYKSTGCSGSCDSCKD